MKKMFNFIVIALALFVWNANAQECSKSKVEKLAKELALTADQKQKVEALYQKCTLNDKDSKANFQAEFKTILSTEQYAEYEKIYGKAVGKKSCCSKKSKEESKSCDKDKKSCCSKKEGKSCNKDKKACSTSQAKGKKSCCKKS